jgi:N-acetylmuramoyl-L-alanine amidase
VPRPLRLLCAAALYGALAAPTTAAAPLVGIRTSSASGLVPFTATLTAPGGALAYRWEFGDGSRGEGQVVTHTWRRAGRYAVRLTSASETGELAQTKVSVTAFRLALSAPKVADFGGVVHFRGRITPAVSGAAYLRRGTRIIARPRLRPGGRFRAATHLASPGPYSVTLAGVQSAPVSVVVRPLIEAALSGPPIVGVPLALRVGAQPAAAGRLELRVSRGGVERLRRTYARGRLVHLGTPAPAFVAVQLVLHPAPGYAPAARALRFSVLPAQLSLGSHGPAVRALQLRLRDLRYALRGVSGSFGYDTYEAVVAFQKTGGLPRTGTVGPEVWRALARAHVPAPRLPTGTHIEVDKTRQLLLEVANGQVQRTLTVSTGATGNTPVGTFHIYRKVAGYDWVLYYPLYFIGGFAVHGYPDVPPYPASHGCVRIPMWLAPSVFARFGYGTTVLVYT